MKHYFLALFSALLLTAAGAMAAAPVATQAEFKIDLPTWSALGPAELQTFLLGLPEANFIKAMQAIASSPQVAFRTRGLAVARNVINSLPASKRPLLIERLQNASPELRTNISATGEASFFTLPNFKLNIGLPPSINPNVSQPAQVP